MRTTKVLAAIFMFTFVTLTKTQENAQTRIPDSLQECYKDPILVQRDFRLPMTMNMLIDLIRKVENDPAGMNMDMKTMVVSLIQRFRLDGIVKSPDIQPSDDVTPYSPKSYQFYKHKIVLSNLVPGNSLQFPNNSLTSMEKCSLHHMMSSTVETAIRNDEGTVCNRLSQYRTQRLPRSDRKLKPDVEVIDKKVLDKINKRGKMRMDLEQDVSIDVFPGVYSTASDSTLSQCPVEDGVVYTQWGSVSVGPLLAGIAAGLQPQVVPFKDFPGPGDKVLYAGQAVTVDNKFASTLSGDLAEASLQLGPKRILSVGAPGGWNNTQAPRWYFLNQNKNYEQSDAEIRGGLDGLILGSNVKSFVDRISSFKLSQLLDMYYSQRGVFTETHRACNRKTQFSTVAPIEKLKTETSMFSLALDKIMQMEVTINETSLVKYANEAVDSLNTYISNSLNDLSCQATATSTLGNDLEAVTDIYVVLDGSWIYQDIYPSIAYLLEHLNIGQIGTSMTMMNAKDGTILVNNTESLADFHQLYNYSVHSRIPYGLDIPKTLLTLKPILIDRMNDERKRNWGGGQSSVVITIANSAGITDGDISYSMDLLKLMREEIPDLRFLYLTSGSRERFNDLVIDPARDIFTLAVSSIDSSASQINPVVKRIKEVPRRLINAKCGGDYQATDGGSTQLYEYVAPQTINYYRLHPNYYFKSNSKVKIQGNGYGSLNVCYSRSVELPRHSNSSLNQDGVTCESLTSNTLEIGLSDACKKKTYIFQCDPLFISVEGLPTTEAAINPRCFERECRYPDSMKYTITMEGLGCYSCSTKNIINSIALITLLLFLFIKNYQ